MVLGDKLEEKVTHEIIIKIVKQFRKLWTFLKLKRLQFHEYGRK